MTNHEPSLARGPVDATPCARNIRKTDSTLACVKMAAGAVLLAIAAMLAVVQSCDKQAKNEAEQRKVHELYNDVRRIQAEFQRLQANAEGMNDDERLMALWKLHKELHALRLQHRELLRQDPPLNERYAICHELVKEAIRTLVEKQGNPQPQLAPAGDAL